MKLDQSHIGKMVAYENGKHYRLLALYLNFIWLVEDESYVRPITLINRDGWIVEEPQKEENKK